MKFYKPLRPFKAISFDLDDTLYDNNPVIEKAEVDFLTYLTTSYSQLEQLDERKWHLYKSIIVKEKPELKHDVTLWRKEILKRIMVVYGMPVVNAIKYSEIALKEFIRLRSNLTVPVKSIKLLNTLAAHYPVVGITNGNVDTQQIGLDDKFSFILSAGNGLKSKPHVDLFQQAALQLDIKIEEILHVGDHLITDVYGAQNNNAQAVWFNPYQAHLNNAKLLPCLEITDLNSLLNLI